jgi:hypothetical protein
MYSETENIFSPFNFDTIGGIFIHRLSHYTVFCEPKVLLNTSNAGTRVNPHALLLQPKPNNLTSDSIQGRTVLSLRGLSIPHTCVFVTVFQAQIYVASTKCVALRLHTPWRGGAWAQGQFSQISVLSTIALCFSNHCFFHHIEMCAAPRSL